MVDTSTISGAGAAVINRRPYLYKPLGVSRDYVSDGENFYRNGAPDYQELVLWDIARRKEPIISQSLEFIAYSVIARLGEYKHPDPLIDNFIKINIKNRYKQWIFNSIETALWSGYSVGEQLFKKKLGPDGLYQTWIDDIIHFHPLQIKLQLNDYGRLTDGEKVYGTQFRSGIWVPMPEHIASSQMRNSRVYGRDVFGTSVRLPEYKRFIVTHKSGGNNPWGRSILEAAVKFHLYKNLVIDYMVTALDRYGTPLISAVVPAVASDEIKEQVDGQPVFKSYREVVQEQFASLGGGNTVNAMVFSRPLGDLGGNSSIDISALTSANNFADSFTSGINLFDAQMLMAIGIPNLLLLDKTSGLGSTRASETQAEKFDTMTGAIFDLFIGEFLEQVIQPLILANFSLDRHPLAYDTGTFIKKSVRTVHLEAVTKALDLAIKHGALNLRNPQDFEYFREQVDIVNRDITPEDKRYISDIQQELTKAIQKLKQDASMPTPQLVAA